MDIPLRISTACDGERPGYRELQAPIEEQMPKDLSNTWQMNYHESAIYLEEGENNDKFDLHPRSKSALPAYLIVHNSWFYTLDLLASVMLMSLALMERPALPTFEITAGIHGSLELLLLAVMCAELLMKLRWMGVQHFIRHPRTVLKLIVLFVMVLEAIVVLSRQTSHFRITRALRPVFLIDNHYCGGVRRMIRQILQSLPPIIDMLALLFFFMVIFAVLGFYMFSPNSKDPYFSTLTGSFVSLFVLLTTANFPDVMMPAYAKSRWSSLFFVIFLIIHLYLLMNLMLAVVYETFTTIEKEKCRKLLLHRRKACQHAFKLLVSQSYPSNITFSHFEGLLSYYKPHKSKRDIYLMFKTLDLNKSGTLSLEEFYQVHDVSALAWKHKRTEEVWFNAFPSPVRNALQGIRRMVTWKWTDFLINIIITANGIWQLVEAAELSSNLGHLDSYESSIIDHVRIEDAASSWVSVGFVSVYTLEAILKILGLGVHKYFTSNWNTYDFIVTVAAIAGLVAEEFGMPFSFVVILRPLRLLRLFKVKKRFRDVLGTVFTLLPRFLSVAMVLMLVYYFYAIIGMELFSDYNMRNCCKNSTVEQFFHFDNSSLAEGYYYLNNFNNIMASSVTLFELMVVNNWFIIMDGYAAVTSDWSRIYFMSFYILTMVVLNIIVAFVLEAFLFRIQYKRKMGDMDKDSLIRVDVSLSSEEMAFCYNNTVADVAGLLISSEAQMAPYALFRGTRHRTKFSFSLKMYSEEVKEWLQEAEL